MPKDATSMPELYHTLRKWFPLISLALGPINYLVDAPFGRFANTPSAANLPSLQLDGTKAWILMELPSPMSFIYATFITQLPAPVSPQAILSGCFLVHYFNRAIVSPLRAPSRSKNNLSVVLTGMGFNLANGYLMGSYTSSPMAKAYLANAFQRPTFWVGIALWVLGFVGNVVHDEVLLNIRRAASARKEKEAAAANGSKEPKGEHYGIPQGLLYKYISFPNYLCEWIEWLGFAIAASPLPLHLSFTSPLAFLSSFTTVMLPLFTLSGWKAILQTPPSTFAPRLTPPWIFLINEIVLMLPRAVKGHQWYHERFGQTFPRDRKAVIPFLL
jgi:3-oxo-5-alpha-steroid 4-dehydrogenase 1